jgi:DNA-binding transcriptional MerR regulator
VSNAAEAFRTISEVSADLDVPKHVLRFWEIKFPQIRPMKRGGGRRYYRPEDLQLLIGIRRLLHTEGYTIKGVQKILREQGVEGVKRAGGVAKAVEPRGIDQNAARVGSERSGRVTQLKSSFRPLRLSARQVEELHRVVSELEACSDLLTGRGGSTDTGLTSNTRS